VPNSSPEADAIQEAFLEYFKTLFVNLATSLGNQPVTHETDQKCLDRFVTGMAAARRAKELALSAVGAAEPIA
jgi:hypothetical protein